MNYKNRSDNYNWFKNNKGNGKSSKDQWKTAWKISKIFMYFSLFVFSMIGCVQSFVIGTTNYVGTGFEIYASEQEIVPSVTEIYVIKDDIKVNASGSNVLTDKHETKFNNVVQMNFYYNTHEKTSETNTMILKDEKINGIDNSLSKIHETVNSQGAKMSDAYRGRNEAVRFITSTDTTKNVPGFKTMANDNEKVSQFSNGNFMVISSAGNQLMGTKEQQDALVAKFHPSSPAYSYYVGKKVYADEAWAGNIVRLSDDGDDTDNIKEDRFGNYNGKYYIDTVYKKEEGTTNWKKPTWVEITQQFVENKVINAEITAQASYLKTLIYEPQIPFKFTFEKQYITYTTPDKEYYVAKGAMVTPTQKDAMMAFGTMEEKDFTATDSAWKLNKEFASGGITSTEDWWESNLESAFNNKLKPVTSKYVYLPKELPQDTDKNGVRRNNANGLRDQYSMMIIDEFMNRPIREGKAIRDILEENPSTYGTTHITNPANSDGDIPEITDVQKYNYMLKAQHSLLMPIATYAGLAPNGGHDSTSIINNGIHFRDNYMPRYSGKTTYRPMVTWGDSWELGPFYALFVYPMGKLSALMISEFPLMAGWGAFFSILIIVLLSRIFTFLLSFKSTLQQTKMTELNAKKAQIDAKYANYQDNKQMKNRQKQEVADLYRREGVNPMGAMGAMFLTMPIFLAIWRVISGVPMLKSTVWLGMTFSATSYKMLFRGAWQYLPIIILSGIVQYVSTKYPQWLTKKRDKLRMNVQQEAAMKKNNKTQNIMAWVMVFMAVIFTAGVQVYWIIGGLWRVLEVTITHKMLHSKKPKKGQMPVPFTTKVKNIFKKEKVQATTTVVTEAKKTKTGKSTKDK